MRLYERCLYVEQRIVLLIALHLCSMTGWNAEASLMKPATQDVEHGCLVEISFFRIAKLAATVLSQCSSKILAFIFRFPSFSTQAQPA